VSERTLKKKEKKTRSWEGWKNTGERMEDGRIRRDGNERMSKQQQKMKTKEKQKKVLRFVFFLSFFIFLVVFVIFFSPFCSLASLFDS
jgi:hypothetical protein